MEQSVEEALSDMHGNYILPFLWMRGETEAIIREEITKIDECGIKAVCLEARPHPDFGGPGWWHDVDIVIDEAKKRNMKIWILDDAHFPTGMANGLLAQKYPERAKKYVMTKCIDVTGPMPYVNLNLTEMMKKQFCWMDIGREPVKPLCGQQEMLSVTAMPLLRDDVVGTEIVDLTDAVDNGMLACSFPGGVWRIFITYTTYDEGGKTNYINLIDEDSVKVLIEAVYEPHFKRYQTEFGHTLAGFFFDEPGMDNTPGFEMNEKIGRKAMALPWCDEITGYLKERMGKGWRTKLPYLWFDAEQADVSAELRFLYMDTVTRLYEKNFSRQLGKWCEAHGVESIGHVVEDNNVHARLGVGPGHFFRALSGQHMAGIDNIGDGIIPGNPDSIRHGFVNKDGAFSHYVIAKMGDTAARLDPAKKGRLLCETYGAYGWGLGVKNMKWITDYLIVQGVNYLVPHAFSMAEYPDEDCPPHFYARGNNPQFPYFAGLMKYANRMCHIFNGGTPRQDVGILYHGELEWMNDCMLMQEPAKVLFENQIDYMIVPVDGLERLEMKVLIIPETRYIDGRLAEYIKAHPEMLFVFINRLPEQILHTTVNMSEWQKERERCSVLSLDELAGELEYTQVSRLKSSVRFPELTYRFYEKETAVCMVMNTSLDKTYRGELSFPCQEQAVRYDCLKNKLHPVKQWVENGRTVCNLVLQPYESAIMVFDPAAAELNPGGEAATVSATVSDRTDISDAWTVSYATAQEYPVFKEPELMERLEPVSVAKPYFSGIMRYERNVQIDTLAERIYLEAEHVFETAAIWVNGKPADKKLCPPYRFDITEACTVGVNQIVIEVVNTPARENQKPGGRFGPERIILEPSGMFGNIYLKQESGEVF